MPIKFTPKEDRIILEYRNCINPVGYEQIRDILHDETETERTAESIRMRYRRLSGQLVNLKRENVDNKFLRLMKKPQKFADIAEEQETTVAEIKQKIRDLEKSGYVFEMIGSDHIVYVSNPVKELNKPFDNHSMTNGESELLIGAIADTHLCSKMDRIDLLDKFYKECRALGVTYVLHAGDVGDGSGRVYKGHLFELRFAGFDNHKAYIRDKYPYIPGIKTIMIPGNHDESYYADSGGDLLDYVAKERDDFVYLPNNRTRVFLGDEKDPFKIVLQHGMRSATKVISYRLQEYIEGANNIFDRDVDMLILGHYHQLIDLPFQSVLGIMPGGFQDPTKLLLRMPHPPTRAGVIVKVTREENSWAYEVMKRKYR